jgi:hypothetical protein
MDGLRTTALLALGSIAAPALVWLATRVAVRWLLRRESPRAARIGRVLLALLLPLVAVACLAGVAGALVADCLLSAGPC